MYKPSEIEQKAIGLLQAEMQAWERGFVFVTPKIAFDMRNIIERSIKNYYGIFDKPKDEVTGRDKFFVPLTESVVEGIVKNIDLDTDDIKLRASNPDRIGSTAVLRHILQWFLKKNYFGETLNEIIRMTCITGTQVVRIVKEYDPVTQKQCVRVVPIHPLNVLIDPSAENLQDVPLIVRDVMTVAQVKGKRDWMNKEYVMGIDSVEKFYRGPQLPNHEVPMVDVYERWGLLPAELVGGTEGTWVNGRIIVSGFGKNTVVHMIKQEAEGYKPFEELRFKRIPGRWHGRGLGEILLQSQEFINEFVNVRFAGNRIRMLGLWNARKGANIPLTKLQGLYSGAVIESPRMGDIQGLVPPPIPTDAILEDQRIMDWAQKATQSQAARQQGPASRSATVAAIQAQEERVGYALVQEEIGLFLEKVFERHYIPMMLKTLNEDEVISITGNPKDLQTLDEAVISDFLNDEILKYHKLHSVYPSEEEIASARTKAENKMRRFGDARFIKVQNDILDTEYSAQVFVTDETINRTQMIQSLNEMLRNYAAIPNLTQQIDVDLIVKEVLDLLGVGGDRFFKKKEPGATPITQGQLAPTPTAKAAQSPTMAMTQAMTQQGVGRAGF